MAGAFSQHLLNSYYTHTQRRAPFATFGESTAPTDLALHGAMSFAPGMHGSFREHPSFDTQPSFLDVSEATATRIAQLQAKLDRKLGPEFVSQRPGPGGGPKLTYAEGWKIINLANEIFGFNGWSSSIVNLTVDFIDFNEESKRYTVGTTAIIRVTLRDGVFHEDVGYGMLENSKSKGQALDKCKKEAVTDGVKRALRSFGNVLGNCLYDKDYTKEITKMKPPPVRFDKDELHRRPEFATVPNASTSSSSSRPVNNNILGPVQTNAPPRAPQMKPPAPPAPRAQAAVPSPLRLPRDLQAKPAPAPAPAPKPAPAQFEYTTAAEFDAQVPEAEAEGEGESLEFFAPSDDEAMLAALDLASGVGGPIYPEDETVVEPSPPVEEKPPAARSNRSNAIAAALAAFDQDASGPSTRPSLPQAPARPPAAPQAPAPPAPRSEARNQAQPTVAAAAKPSTAPTSSPSMGGGFNLPPGFKPPTASRPPGWQAASAGMKRPADAMQSGTSARRPMQGMGLSHQPVPTMTSGVSRDGRAEAEAKRMRV